MILHGIPKKSCGRPLRRLVIAQAIACVLIVSGCRDQRGGSGSLPEEQVLREKIALLSLQEQILSADYSLARNPAPYLALDGANRKIEFKVQGRALRSFGVTRFQRSGVAPAAATVWSKTGIKPLQNAARERVVPGSGEATTASVAAKAPWGPQRMPSDYDVICKGDFVLEIRALPAESRNRFVRWVVGGYRRASDWTREVFNRRNAGSKTVIEVWMGEDDARLLFWSFPKQFAILLLNIP